MYSHVNVQCFHGTQKQCYAPVSVTPSAALRAEERNNIWHVHTTIVTVISIIQTQGREKGSIEHYSVQSNGAKKEKENNWVMYTHNVSYGRSEQNTHRNWSAPEISVHVVSSEPPAWIYWPKAEALRAARVNQNKKGCWSLNKTISWNYEAWRQTRVTTVCRFISPWTQSFHTVQVLLNPCLPLKETRINTVTECVPRCYSKTLHTTCANTRPGRESGERVEAAVRREWTRSSGEESEPEHSCQGTRKGNAVCVSCACRHSHNLHGKLH